MHQPTTDDPLAQRVAATGCPRPILWDFGSISSTCSTPAPRRWAIARADIVHSTREVPLNTAARLNAGDMNVFACLSRLPGPRRRVGYQGRSGSMVDRVRFTLLLSPGVECGLSGEEPCSTTSTRPAGWAGVLDPARLAADAGLGPDEVRGVLSALAVSGKVGYDWARAAYFHRELPYRPEPNAQLNPRLTGARALVPQVRPGSGGFVVGDHLVHNRPGGGFGCTCRWRAEHGRAAAQQTSGRRWVALMSARLSDRRRGLVPVFTGSIAARRSDRRVPKNSSCGLLPHAGRARGRPR